MCLLQGDFSGFSPFQPHGPSTAHRLPHPHPPHGSVGMAPGPLLGGGWEHEGHPGREGGGRRKVLGAETARVRGETEGEEGDRGRQGEAEGKKRKVMEEGLLSQPATLTGLKTVPGQQVIRA